MKWVEIQIEYGHATILGRGWEWPEWDYWIMNNNEVKKRGTLCYDWIGKRLSHTCKMGLQVLKVSPLSSSKTLVFTQKRVPLLQLLDHFQTAKKTSTNFRHHIPSGLLPSKPVRSNLYAAGFGQLFHQSSKRSVSGGRVVAMASPGPVQKSEEEWRAVLSPEQFRILRQKGTE